MKVWELNRGTSSLICRRFKSDSPFPFEIGSQAAPISVHKGYRIEAALCVTRFVFNSLLFLIFRMPIIFKEPQYAKEWRLFEERWKNATNTKLILNDVITFMGFPDQFLLSEEEKRKRELLATTTGNLEESEIDTLLGQEMESKRQLEALAGRERRKVASGKKEVKQKTVIIPEFQKFDRLPYDPLYLIIKKENRWQFPKSSRIHGDSMRETLARIAAEQLGKDFTPYLVAACPFTVEKRRLVKTPGLEGRKTFFYKAYIHEEAGDITGGEGVEDWAIVSRSELKDFIGESKFAAVEGTLPLWW